MTIRRLIYFSDRAAGLLGTISSSTVNAAIEKAYGAPVPAQDERLANAIHVGLELTGVIDEYRDMPCDSLRQRMFSTADRYRSRLNPAQAEQQPAYVECRECTGCGHVGINDAHQTDATCAMCDWSGPSPVEDQCPDCGKENVMGAACPKCSGRYRILAETHVATPIAQTAPQPEQSGLRAGQVVAMCEVGHDRLERAALDTKRLEWMLAERCIIESQNGTGSPTVYRVVWPSLGEAQSEWYPTEREAIDHARGCRHE